MGNVEALFTDGNTRMILAGRVVLTIWVKGAIREPRPVERELEFGVYKR